MKIFKRHYIYNFREVMQVTRLHNLKGHRDAIYSLQPSAAGNIFFSAGGDGMVVQWDLNDPETGHVIARLPNSIYALYFFPKTLGIVP